MSIEIRLDPDVAGELMDQVVGLLKNAIVRRNHEAIRDLSIALAALKTANKSMEGV